MPDPTYIDWNPATAVVTKAGETTTWRSQVRDGQGNVVDISDWTFGFFATDQEDPENTIELDDTDFAITDDEEGQYQWVTSTAITQDQGGNNFLVEVWRLDTGFEHCLATGPWEIEQSIRF